MSFYSSVLYFGDVPEPDRTPPETPNGSTYNFSTSMIFKSGSTRVFLDGQLMTLGESQDYTEDGDRKGYTFEVAPLTGSIVTHFYYEDI